MDSGGFYNEGLLSAVCGLPAQSNPYPEGTGFHENWRRGFNAYGVAGHDDRAGEEAVQRCSYLKCENASLSSCPWVWCLVHGVAA